MSRHACMNRAYALVWNERQQAYVPAPETARRRGKRTGTVLATAIAALFGGPLAYADGAIGPPGAMVLPGGGKVSAGQASIAQSAGQMTISQTTNKAAIDWQSFNIGSSAKVTFVQPSSSAIALNRIIGQEPSRIFGSLQANGQVFLLNPNGVMFAPGAQVDVGGLLASTRKLDNADFLDGKLTLSGDSNGQVVNQGRIRTGKGGYVALVGAQVINQGEIRAEQGAVHLAAADQVTLKIDGAGLTALSVDRGTLEALAANQGLIKADGGRIYLTADALDHLARAVVNNQGVIEAQTVENRNGTIVLMGDMKCGSVQVGGTLDASAPNGGNGGFIETSAAHVQFSPAQQVSARASNGKTGTWLIDPVDFTIAASGGDITGAQLSSNLAGVNVTIQSTSGAQGTAGDINVNDVVTWSANKLTLNAQNNINLNANLNGSGGALLALEYGQGAVASGNASKYNLASGVKVSLPAGNTFSTKLGSDGTTTNFYVINSLGAEGSSTTTDLQGMRAGVTGNYALGADIDASATSTWQSGQGFTFIGTQGNVFSGNFEGLGHTIDNLFENWAVGYVGLIGKLDATGRVGNLHLTNVNISGGLDNVGGLVGYNDKGVIEHVSVQGKINGGNNNVGGVIGFNDGTVTDAHANTVNVTGKNYATGGLIGKQSSNGITTMSDSSGTVAGFYDVGGLIGSSSTDLNGLHSSATVNPSGGESGGLVGRANGKITNSYATGNITAPGGDLIGGLVGQADGAISDSYATGNVVGGGGYTGGMAGKTNGNISNSYATGKVDGAHIVGGLTGYQKSGTVISDSYATGNVTGTLYSVGGLVGLSSDSIHNSYATGNVKSTTDAVGGLVGSWSSGNSPEIKDSYSTGTVEGRYAVGGLIGDMSACYCFVKTSHATGKISGTADYIGGLIGYVDLGEVSDSWATGDVSGVNNVGGLTGQGVNITKSYATGKISGETNIGGLVGLEKMGGVVTGSYATGDVTGTVEAAGGLVGRNEGTVTGSSYSTSLVVGATSVGGLVGGNYGTVSDSQTGKDATPGPVVTGKTGTGGLIGYNNGSVSNGLATGDISGSSDYTGGLIGFNDTAGTVTGSKATGTVTGKAAVGGLIGENDGTVNSSHFDVGTVNGVDQIGGLVGFNASTGKIGSASYTKQAVTGSGNEVGGLVGQNRGTVGGGSYANGTVNGVDRVGGLIGLNKGGSLDTVSSGVGTVTGHDQVGGLIGLLEGGTVTQASATGAVTGNEQVGGFVGNTSNSKSTITKSTASGAVSAVSMAGGFVGYNQIMLSGNPTTGNTTSSSVTVSSGQAGGFAGVNSGKLGEINSTNNVSISGSMQDVGGIVGVNLSGGTLQTSHAANTVLAGASNNVGGAVGRNDSGATIITTYATNSVTGFNATGGLIGLNDGVVAIAYAANTVAGNDNVGGLIGKQGSNGDASNVYAASTTGGHSHVGGLVGYGGGKIDYTYASGAVTGSGTNVGGLLGSKNSAQVNHSYFDLDSTGQAHSTGDYGTAGEVAAGKTTAEMKVSATFTDWDLSSEGGDLNIWRSYETQTRPLLRHWLTPLEITATFGTESHVYDGTVHTITASGVSYTETLPNGHLLGSAPSLSGKNVGVYNSAAGFYSDQQGYDIAFPGGGTLTITPVTLTGTAAAATKPYDGTTNATLAAGGITLAGFINGEGATSLAISGTYNSKNVVGATTVNYGTLNAGSFVANNGTLLSNYVLPDALSGSGSITALPITASFDAVEKVYDGTTAAQVKLGSIVFSGFVMGESATVASVSANFNSKNVAEADTVVATFGALTPGGGADFSNYVMPSQASGGGSIAPKTIQVTATGIDKVYDGNSQAQARLASSDLIPGDVVTLTGTGQFGSKNVGTAKPVTITGIASDSSDAANYRIGNTSVTTTANITPKPLSVTATASDKVYDGNTIAQIVLGSSGIIAGDDLQLSGSGNFVDKHVGTGKRVNVAGLVKSGADAGNYSLPADAVSTTATISPRPLNLTATAEDKVYDGGTGAKINLGAGNIVTGDDVHFSGSGAFVDKNVGTAKQVRIGNLVLSGADATNYLTDGNSLSTTASITAKALTVSATASDKEYDGNTAAQVTLTPQGVVAGDQVQISGTGNFADKNAGNGKAVHVTGLQASGEDRGNYSYGASDISTTASITPRLVTVTLQGVVVKVADGTTAATLNGGNYAIGNLVSGESIDITQLAGQYDTANPGSGKLVTVALASGSYSASGSTLLSNYQLRTGNVAGNIGTITAANPPPVPPATNVDSNNQGQLSGTVGTISLPQAFNGVLTTLPDTSVASTDSGRTSITVSNSGSTQVTSSNQQANDPLAPAAASAVSTNTRENLLFRRAFSIGDGGIRLPQGVRGSDKDAPQQ